MSVRSATSIVGVDAAYRAAAFDSSITYDASNYDETNHSSQYGMAATLVSGATAGLGSGESVLYGVIARVEADTVTLQVRGGVAVAYDTGHVPTVGAGVTANGAGAVRAPGGSVTARGAVYSLDTTNHICYLDML